MQFITFNDDALHLVRTVTTSKVLLPLVLITDPSSLDLKAPFVHTNAQNATHVRLPMNTTCTRTR
jgi:hypothetical protein